MSSQQKNRRILKRMKPIGDSMHINLLLTRELVRQIDEVRRSLPGLPNRSEAIRMLLATALDKKLKPSKKGE